MKGWTSTVDGDGCKDLDEEDPTTTATVARHNGCLSWEFDGDGARMLKTQMMTGTKFVMNLICVLPAIDWSSGTLTDHDGDGCKDMHSEDADDDNDGIADTIDQCSTGATNWPSNINTDFDGDGCKDGFEDEDDDGDGISNAIDNCPRSIGVVNAQGCSATQTLDSEGGASTVYYVCPVGSIVVLDPSDCPDEASSGGNENTGGEDDDTFYYVCPEAPTSSRTFPSVRGPFWRNKHYAWASNNSGDYITCEGGVAIVLDESNCPEAVKQDSASSNQESSENNLMVLFMGGTFAMSAIAMVVVLMIVHRA